MLSYQVAKRPKWTLFLLNGTCDVWERLGVLVVSCLRKKIKVGVISYGEMEKRDLKFNQKKLSANRVLTHEPWACDKSVVDMAHVLMRHRWTRPARLSSLTSLALFNTHSFLRPSTNEHAPHFPPVSSSV